MKSRFIARNQLSKIYLLKSDAEFKKIAINGAYNTKTYLISDDFDIISLIFKNVYYMKYEFYW